MEDLEFDPTLLGLGELEVEEIGAVIRRLPQPQRGQVVRTMNKAVNRAVVNNIVTKGQQYLQLKAKDLSPQSQALLKEGKMKYGLGIFFIRRDISAQASIFDMLDATIDKASGVTNIDKQKLGSGVNLAVNRIELNYDNKAAGATVKTADLAPIAVGVDNALFNGEIEIKLNNRVKLRFPVNSALEPKAADCPKNGINLPTPILIKETDEIQITVYFAGTMASAGSTVDILEAKLIGDATGISQD